jgi:hypothetical protein
MAGSKPKGEAKSTRKRCDKHNPNKSTEQRACPACTMRSLAWAVGKAQADGGADKLGQRAARLMAQNCAARTYWCAGCVGQLAEQPERLKAALAMVDDIERASAIGNNVAMLKGRNELTKQLKKRFYPTTKCEIDEHIERHNGGRCLCRVGGGDVKGWWYKCKDKQCCAAHPYAGLGVRC